MKRIAEEKKLISIVTPCYNEESNVEEVYRCVRAEFERLPGYRYEHIFIDNASTDATAEILRRIAADDRRVKVILNIRNFGHIRSPFHAILQANGDAVISLVADLQDPPAMIPRFLEKWEEGSQIVVGVKAQSRENPIVFGLRKAYYGILHKMSEAEQIQNFTGFGLYDRKFIRILRTLDEPYPYFRGLVAEFGFQILRLPYVQPARKRGKTKNNFYTLYDMAMTGFVNHTKLPLRLASFFGFFLAFVSGIISIVYFVYKLLHWSEFNLGLAPLVTGFFFISSVQLIFIGIIGEYIGAIYTQVKRRPHVIEKERINFQ